MSDTLKYKNDSELNDAWIHGLAEAALMLNGRLNKYDFKMKVTNQIIELSGEVNTLIDEWLCIELLKGIKVIKKVINNLRVVELELIPNHGEVVTSREAYFDSYNDLNTTAEVKAKLEWNNALSGKEIEVITKKGVVTLAGEVDYQANKALAELIISKIVQVKEVRNKIKVNK